MKTVPSPTLCGHAAECEVDPHNTAEHRRSALLRAVLHNRAGALRAHEVPGRPLRDGAGRLLLGRDGRAVLDGKCGLRAAIYRCL